MTRKMKARLFMTGLGIALLAYLFFINRPIPLAFIEIFRLKTASIYTSSKVIHSEMEAAPFNLNGLLYLVSARDKKKSDENGFLFFDANHRKIGFFPTESFLPASLAVGEDVFVTASDYSKDKPESRISLFKFNKGMPNHPLMSNIISSTKTKFFNTSLTYDAKRNNYVLAYEIDEPGLFPFSIRFLTSRDLRTWDQVDYTFHPDEYAACPTIRVIDGVYYLWYLERLKYSRVFVTKIARSHDLTNWQTSKITFLSSTKEEGINASDFDYINIDGKSHIFYATGNQLTDGYAYIKYAVMNFEIDKVADAFFDADPESALGKLGIETRHSLDLVSFVAADAFSAGIKLLPSEGSLERYWNALAKRF
jgi:hypothetical protein